MFNTEGGKKVQNALDESRKKDINVLELKGLELKHTNMVLIKSWRPRDWIHGNCFTL